MRKLLAVALLLFVVSLSHAQTYLNATGSPTFNTPAGVELGYANLSNGNLHLQVPFGNWPQRGAFQVTAGMVYDSRIWQINGSNQWQPTNVASSMAGWRFATTIDPGAVTESVNTSPCSGGALTTYQAFIWTDPQGTQRAFPITTSQNTCTGQNVTTGNAFATDSSGFHMYVTSYTSATVFAKNGSKVFPSSEDTNGNFFTVDGNGSAIDTLGRTVATKTTNGAVIDYDVLNSQYPTGSTSRYIVTTESISVSTAFNQSGVTEYSGNITAVKSIDLPDGSSYSFAYDTYGEVNSLTLRTGGQVTYAYTNFSDSYGNINRWVNTRVSGGGTWTYAPAVVTICSPGTVGCTQTNTVSQPSGDQTVYTFTLNNGAWNTQTQAYNGSKSGTLLRTVATTFDFSNACPFAGCFGNAYIRPTQVVTTDPIPGSSINKQVKYGYDSIYYGNVNAEKEWRYYSGSPSANPDRETDTTYLTSYNSKDILDRPLSVIVKSGSGTQVAETDYSYDGTTLTPISGIAHHDDTNFGTGNTTRGNPSKMQRWFSGVSCATQNNTCLVTTNTFDTTGQLISVSDPKQNVTNYSYADAFYTDNGQNTPPTYTPSTPTNAYLTKTTYPDTHTFKYHYYFGSGHFAWDTDENTHSSFRHYIDPLDRMTENDGRTVNTGSSHGWQTYVYPSASPFTQTDSYLGITSTNPSISCTFCRHDITMVDGLGRTTRTTLANDPDGQTFVDAAYDSTGRTQSQSNPYRTTQDPTYGLESFSYDGLNRTTANTHQDSNVDHSYFGAAVSTGGGATAQLCSSSTYGLGYPLLNVDEAGKKSQIWADGFGRTIEADEPDSSNNLTIATCSTYDANDNLTQVVQGSEARTYVYDGLSRQTSATEPESGTTSSFYTTSTGAFCSGVAANACRITDARSKTSTYAYDSRDRLTSKTYSDSTPTITYFYDQTSYNGLTITNGKGRRTGMSDGSGNPTGMTAWSYDPVGNVLTREKKISSVTKSIAYTYNLDNSLATVEYPFITSNKTVTYTYNNAQRQISAVDTGLNNNYALSATYAPAGGLATAIHGKVSGGFNGITRTKAYNNRLQTASIADSSSNGTIQNYSYSYDQGGGVNNGNTASVTDNVTSGRSQSFTYDNLNRIATAQSTATSGQACWGQNFTLDRYGNYLSSTVTKCSAPAPNFTVNTNNQITNTGFTYDAAGNLTNDGSQAYVYDAENHQTSAAGNTYTYDGDDYRVSKSTGELDWFDEGGNLLAETDSSGGDTRHFIYFAGRLIARREYATGNVYYYFGDHLDTTRNFTDSTGHVQFSSDFYPYGGENNIYDCSVGNHCSASDALGTNEANHTFKFSSKKRDPESGKVLDYSHFRMLHISLGRWTSNDPAMGDISSPQTLNRYAYVKNNPINRVDPEGLDDSAPAGGIVSIPGYGGVADVTASFEPIATVIADIQLSYWSPWSDSVNVNARVDDVPPDVPGLRHRPPQPPRWPTPTPHFRPMPRRQYHYCGPGTGKGDPFNQIDRLCAAHDLCYQDCGLKGAYLPQKLSPAKTAAKARCDSELCNGLRHLHPHGWKEKTDIWLIEKTFDCD